MEEMSDSVLRKQMKFDLELYRENLRDGDNLDMILHIKSPHKAWLNGLTVELKSYMKIGSKVLVLMRIAKTIAQNFEVLPGDHYHPFSIRLTDTQLPPSLRILSRDPNSTDSLIECEVYWKCKIVSFPFFLRGTEENVLCCQSIYDLPHGPDENESNTESDGFSAGIASFAKKKNCKNSLSYNNLAPDLSELWGASSPSAKLKKSYTRDDGKQWKEDSFANRSSSFRNRSSLRESRTKRPTQVEGTHLSSSSINIRVGNQNSQKRFVSVRAFDAITLASQSFHKGISLHQPPKKATLSFEEQSRFPKGNFRIDVEAEKEINYANDDIKIKVSIINEGFFNIKSVSLTLVQCVFASAPSFTLNEEVILDKVKLTCNVSKNKMFTEIMTLSSKIENKNVVAISQINNKRQIAPSSKILIREKGQTKELLVQYVIKISCDTSAPGLKKPSLLLDITFQTKAKGPLGTPAYQNLEKHLLGKVPIDLDKNIIDSATDLPPHKYNALPKAESVGYI